MKEEIPQLSGPWGSAYFDELEQPVFRYAPPPQVDRLSAGMQPVSVHRFGNTSVAALAAGDGRLFPLISSDGRLVSLCGDPLLPPAGAGNRLFVVEGGLVRPVVGPDHPLSDRSDMICAPCLLNASGIESDVVTPDLAVRCRVTVPLEGTPTLLVWMKVSNHSQGTRWVTLWNLWRFAPVILETRFLEKAPLTRRLAAALGIQPRERVDNSYFSVAAEGGGGRVQVAVDWDAERADTRWKGVRPLSIPRIQVVALTRNVELGAAGIPQQLLSVLAPETAGRPEETEAHALVTLRASFEVRSHDNQVAAAAIHVADWDRAKAGLKRLMPLGMHVENEGILYRKRFACCTERVRPGQREVDRWQGAWQAAMAGSLGLKDVGGGGGTLLPAVGELLRTDSAVPVRDQAVAAVSLAFNHPALCVPLLDGLVSSAVDAVEAFHGMRGRPSLVAEDLAWLLWALAESDGILGWSQGRTPPADLSTLLVGAASLLGLKELRGPHGLLTTAFADPSDVPHSGPHRVAREAGNVETVAGSAMLMAACSAAARQFAQQSPEAAEELSRVALAMRSGLDALAGGAAGLPCWFLGETLVGNGDLRPVQLAWLLLATECPANLRAGALEAARRMIAGGRGGLLATQVDPDPSAPSGRVDLVENALLVAALARVEPALALSLFESLQPDAQLRDRPGDWTSIFVPGVIQLPQAPAHQRPVGSAGHAWASAVRTADGRGCAAVHFARSMLVGVAAVQGGFSLLIDLFEQLAVRSPVLSVIRTGSRIHGVWQGAAPSRTVRLSSARPGEIPRWHIFKGTPAPEEGSGEEIVFQVKSGESWGIELS